MKAEAIIEAAMRGLVKALLDVPATAHPGKPPSKRTPRRARHSPSGAPSVAHADLPLPGFDPAAEDLPLVPPATLRDMEAAMERITRGNAVPPGMYEPEDAVTRVPLS